MLAGWPGEKGFEVDKGCDIVPKMSTCALATGIEADDTNEDELGPKSIEAISEKRSGFDVVDLAGRFGGVT